MPHHSAPRLGSVCPHSGIAPWARCEGPSMAQRSYPGIHAGMPTPQCLRSASVVNGAPRSTSDARRPYSRPGSSSRTPIQLWERASSRRRRHIQHRCKQTHRYREQARLPQGSAVDTDPMSDQKSVWEQSLLARRPDRRPALTGVPNPIVGASLLAKAALHSASMQADPPPSRASSAPTGLGGGR